MRIRPALVAVVIAASLAAACNSADNAASPGTSPGSPAALGATSGGDFCTLYARHTAWKLDALNSISSPRSAVHSQTVDELLKGAPVQQPQMVAAAPAEPKGYLNAMADPNKMDDLKKNMAALNNWAITHCDAKYKSLFDAAAKLYGH